MEIRKWRKVLILFGVMVGAVEATIFAAFLVGAPSLLTPDIGLYPRFLELAVPGSLALLLTVSFVLRERELKPNALFLRRLLLPSRVWNRLLPARL